MGGWEETCREISIYGVIRVFPPIIHSLDPVLFHTLGSGCQCLYPHRDKGLGILPHIADSEVSRQRSWTHPYVTIHRIEHSMFRVVSVFSVVPFKMSHAVVTCGTPDINFPPIITTCAGDVVHSHLTCAHHTVIPHIHVNPPGEVVVYYPRQHSRHLLQCVAPHEQPVATISVRAPHMRENLSRYHR